MGPLSLSLSFVYMTLLIMSKTTDSQGRFGPRSQAFVNGKIYTVDTRDVNWDRRPKQAMYIENGVIKCLGTNNEVRRCKKRGTREVNLNGATVLPGIHDVHMHPLEVGNPVAGTCTLNDEQSPEELKEIIRRCYKKQKGTEWILGHGYSWFKIREHILAGGRDPKLILDEVIPAGVPAIMMEQTSHSSWANSEALKRAGITMDTTDPPAGLVMKNNSTGEPNGILFENAGDRLFDMALDPSKYRGLNAIAEDGLHWSLEQIAKNGITSICDARTYWNSRGHHRIWQKLAQRGELTARVILGLWAYPELEDDFQIAQLRRLYNDRPVDGLLRMSQIKVYADGILDSTTAALLHDYNVDYNIVAKGNRGMNYFDKARLTKYIRELQDTGFDFHIHAIGDRGVQEALDAIEANRVGSGSRCGGSRGYRHRLTHIEMVDPADVQRFANLCIPADFQVAGNFTLPDNEYHDELVNLIGGRRASRYIPFKEVHNAGAKVTLSSDWDVSGLNPFLGMNNAITRGTASVKLKDAIEMYTINGAYVMRQEDVTGSLMVGKEADFIVINQDILSLANSGQASKIPGTKVLRTFLAGDEVFNAQDHVTEKDYDEYYGEESYDYYK